MYHEYPYDAQIPIKINGKYERREFNSDRDVWDVIKLLIKETQEINEEKGKSFIESKSVMAQLPFFGCKNIMLDENAQKDIARFVYCNDFNVAPYEGSYGDQPKKWIDKSFIIKKIMNNQKPKEENG
jgi:hypothetical protein